MIASGGFDATVRLWAADGRPLATLQKVAISADGRSVASAGLDGTVKLWDSTSFELQRTLRPDRRYERMDITGLTGVTEVQRQTLIALGAFERPPSGAS